MNLDEIGPGAGRARARSRGFASFAARPTRIDDAIDGVTINLLKAERGRGDRRSRRLRHGRVTTRIQNFVTEYNKMQAQLAKLGSYDAATQDRRAAARRFACCSSIEAGHAPRDHEPRGRLERRRTRRWRASASRRTATGTLQLDAAKLTKALDADPERSRTCSARKTASPPDCSRRSKPPGERQRSRYPQHDAEERQLDDIEPRQGSSRAAHGADRSALPQAVHGARLAAVAAAVDVELPDAAAGEPAEERDRKMSG